MNNALRYQNPYIYAEDNTEWLRRHYIVTLYLFEKKLSDLKNKVTLSQNL